MLVIWSRLFVERVGLVVWVQNFEGGSVASRGDNLRESVRDLDHLTAIGNRCVALSPFGRSSSLG